MKPLKAFAKTARRQAGTMNKTEEAYSKLLEERRIKGEIHHWSFEAINLKLAKLTSYLPDFFVINADGSIEFIEIKGFWTSSARVKIKVAADKHPWFTFRAVQYKKKEWSYEEF